MPIRLNLLAEAQAQEEMRRRDPVKRMIWAGLIVVALVLAWISSLQLKVMIAKGELTRLQGQVASKTNDHRLALETQRQFTETRNKLAALDQMVTNRFLHGTVLNALQQSALDDVELVRVRIDQNFAVTAGAAGKKPTPAKHTEKVALTIEARDCGPNPGDLITGYKTILGGNAYFHGAMGTTNVARLIHLGTQQTRAEGKPFVQFALECRYPDKIR